MATRHLRWWIKTIGVQRASFPGMLCAARPPDLGGSHAFLGGGALLDDTLDLDGAGFGVLTGLLHALPPYLNLVTPPIRSPFCLQFRCDFQFVYELSWATI
jgi:hypothetical protein